MPLTQQTLDKLRGIVDAACADRHYGIPGTTVVVVDSDGNELFAHSAGKRGVSSSSGDVTLDSIYWIASCTKMLTGIACMQLVERGVLDLDDGDQLEGLCRELADLQVLKPDGSLERKKRKITLRMLLTHTSGFGYTFFNDALKQWSLPAGVDEFSGRLEDVVQPLLFQPGEGWQYGVGIDWAGIALERATGSSLNDYLQRNVFRPLGIENMSMFPSAEMKSRLAHMHTRRTDGSLVERDHLLRLPLVCSNEEASRCLNSGGAGMFAKPQEYCKILGVLLNDGKCPKTGTTILRKETVKEMCRNQISKFPQFGRQGIAAAKEDLTNAIPDIYPTPGNAPQGWGLTFMLSNASATGRSSSTFMWAGLANCWWWADPEKGIAGMVCTQILPFADAKVLGLWSQVETEVYSALEKGNL
ncbi:beta-lactamase/transpeptidase-like protein [Zalerion maritima]|uniref:Beta-lactamase/transpeptidase-like protein n=1 Tax=Zalerion maritima TaxID=339359 RepID=A0AAD5WU09_9PEZI|nr:beta-lactamase/transpeptidase-like protein [Zalerion maritima]